MSGFRSLRWHLIVGALLWTLGLFAIAGIVLTHLVTTNRHAAVVFHLPFTNVGVATVIAIALLTAGLAQVRRGVSPIAQLRTRLSAVHQGRERRVEGNFPEEVEPLVTDLNALLEHHERTVARAQAKAGDLAHGLKTPLAVLLREAATAEASGRADVATAIRAQVDRMQRQIDWHLAHARAAASAATPGVYTSLAESVDGLLRTVIRIYADRGLDPRSNVAPSVAVGVQRQDLDEMVGNLLDNACKWARTTVLVSATEHSGVVDISVDDDGAGVPEERRQDVLQRGVRADEHAPGSGFGLAIVRDLAELYGGRIHLERSPLGGLRAVLTLPRVAPGA